MILRYLQNNLAGRWILNRLFYQRFGGSEGYWEERYFNGGNSGAGSYAGHATYKARFLNDFVKEHQVETVMEFGCGDGNQLGLFTFPVYYGLDVSATALEKCRAIFPDATRKVFFLLDDTTKPKTAELTLSLDVLYHLVEDAVFEMYLYELFDSATRFVIIYAWDVAGKQQQHVRHRKFSAWIAAHISGWQLAKQVPAQEGHCDFFVYAKNDLNFLT